MVALDNPEPCDAKGERSELSVDGADCTTAIDGAAAGIGGVGLGVSDDFVTLVSVDGIVPSLL